MWKQRSRMEWLQGGDRNAAFFKAKASRIKERKIIEMLMKSGDTLVHDHEGIMQEFVKYFKSIFSTSYEQGSPCCPEVCDVLNTATHFR